MEWEILDCKKNIFIEKAIIFHIKDPLSIFQRNKQNVIKTNFPEEPSIYLHARHTINALQSHQSAMHLLIINHHSVD